MTGEPAGEGRSAYQDAPDSNPHAADRGDRPVNGGRIPRPFLRPRSPRILGGVCAAFAQHYGWSLDLVRVLTAVFALFYGVGILAYIACWIIIPEEQYALPSQSR